jgi:hypothetical protein
MIRSADEKKRRDKQQDIDEPPPPVFDYIRVPVQAMEVIFLFFSSHHVGKQ